MSSSARITSSTWAPRGATAAVPSNDAKLHQRAAIPPLGPVGRRQAAADEGQALSVELNQAGEGGDGGGTIVCTGTPEEVADCPASYTGQYLKKVPIIRGLFGHAPKDKNYAAP